MDDIKSAPIREHLTVLLRRRSVIALCCAILTLALAFYGVTEGVNRTNTVFHENGFRSFIYYTMLSNAFAALSAAFIFPFTVEGIRKEHEKRAERGALKQAGTVRLNKKGEKR